MEPDLSSLLSLAREALRKGAAPGDVDAWVAHYSGGKFKTLGEASDQLGPGGLWRPLAQGPTLGFADEIYGAGKAIVGGDYKAARDEFRAKEAMTRAAYPKASMGLELGGSLLLPVGAGAKTVAKGVQEARVLRGIARGAATGAAVGGASGVGHSEAETVPGMLADAAPSVALGTVLGGGASAAAESAPGLVEWMSRRFKPDAAAPRLAHRYLADLVEMLGGEPAVRASIQKLEAARPGETMILDSHRAFPEVLDAVMQANPLVKSHVLDLLAARKDARSARLLRDLESLGLGRFDRTARRAGLENARRAQANTDYAPLNGQTTDHPGIIGTPSPDDFGFTGGFLQRPVVRNAYRAVQEQMGMVGEQTGGMPTLEELQGVRAVLGRAAERVGKAGDRAGAANYRKAQQELTDLMHEAFGDRLKIADANYAAGSAPLDAMLTGKKAFDLPAEDLAAHVRALRAKGGDDAVTQFQQSAFDHLVRQINSQAQGRNVTSQFLESRGPEFERKLLALFEGDKAVLQRLKDVMGWEQAAARTDALTARGSATDVRRSLREALAGGETAPPTSTNPMSFVLSLLKTKPDLAAKMAPELQYLLMGRGEDGLNRMFSVLAQQAERDAGTARLRSAFSRGLPVAAGAIPAGLLAPRREP